MRAAIATLLFLAAAVPLAYAVPFRIRYDPTDAFPEGEGWTRYTNDYGNQVCRTLTGDTLIVDTSASSGLFESYFVDLPDISAEMGERLEIRWRMRTTFDTTPVPEASDVAVTVINADDAYVTLYLGEDCVANYPEIPVHRLSGDGGEVPRIPHGCRHGVVPVVR